MTKKYIVRLEPQEREDLQQLVSKGKGAARKLAPAQCDTIRLKLLKACPKPRRIGARIRVTVRKVWVSPAESFPSRVLFQRVYENLIRRCPLPLRC
jgi:hypothetical protein